MRNERWSIFRNKSGWTYICITQDVKRASGWKCRKGRNIVYRALMCFCRTRARARMRHSSHISQLRARASYIVPMNTIHHRLHCAMHTDTGTDYTKYMYVCAHVRIARAAERRLSSSIRSIRETHRAAHQIILRVSHFVPDFARARKVTKDLNNILSLSRDWLLLLLRREF